MTELDEIREFIKASHISDSIAEMEVELETAITWESRVGFLCNEAESVFEKKYAEHLTRLEGIEETETTRKAKLAGWLADEKKSVADLKVMKHALKQIVMSLLQAIKTRRDEMMLINRSRP